MDEYYIAENFDIRIDNKIADTAELLDNMKKDAEVTEGEIKIVQKVLDAWKVVRRYLCDAKSL